MLKNILSDESILHKGSNVIKKRFTIKKILVMEKQKTWHSSTYYKSKIKGKLGTR